MKKRIILLVLMIGLVITSCAIATDGHYVWIPELDATVNNPNPADRLNLRTKPSEEAPTLGKYYTGTFVEVLEDDNSGWVKVRFCNLEGYMMKKYLAFGEDRGNVRSALPGVKINNAGGTGLNLRETQSVNSLSLGLYKNGETVLVFGVDETWCHVQVDGKIGFMLREKLSPILAYHNNTTNSADNKSIPAAMVNNLNPEDRLNLRTAPSTDAPTLGKYYNGTQVELLSTEKNGWIKVRIGNLDGYMLAEFLKSDPYHVVNSVLPSFNVNSGTGLNLRESQSLNSKSLGLYKDGDSGWVYGVGETWCHVRTFDGKMGFMLREGLLPVLEFDKGTGGSSGGTPPAGYIDPLEGTWQGEPGDEITDDFMPGGNG